ncbi:MAG TPA: hypothetical protein VL981_12725 [Candidatus Methylacidiphilales bacterium]|nr:hypothetical protein [Candidatus Methylacidiphilales bacterium]
MDPSEPRDTVLSILVRWTFHFLIGVLFGALPAVAAFGVATMSDSVDLWKAAGWSFLFCCLPVGVICWLLGLWERGRLLYGILKVLDFNFPYWF